MSFELLMPFLTGVALFFLLIFGFFVLFKAFYIKVPQGTALIVKKAYNMAGMMHIPVLGVVENYSYFECPDCGKRISLFGESHIDEVAKELGIDVLGKLPLDPKYAQAADEGRFFELENPNLEAGVEKIGNI